MSHGFHIVLVEPEIPQNTGSIGRLCVATQSTLHLIEPLGFDISDRAVKRAGLDYWEHLSLVIHKNIDHFLNSIPEDAPKILLTKKSVATIYDRQFLKGTYFIFGKETAGLPDWLMEKYSSDCVRIPMFDSRVRSINLSNAVSVALYEGIRQLGF